MGIGDGFGKEKGKRPSGVSLCYETRTVFGKVHRLFIRGIEREWERVLKQREMEATKGWLFFIM